MSEPIITPPPLTSSSIDPTKPTEGTATTQSVRDNFSAAKTEIENLQSRTGSGWNDLVQDVKVNPGASNAPGLITYRDNIITFAFQPNSVNECFTNFHMRHDYIPGTMVYPHVHWSTNSTMTGNVRWGVEYTIARRWESTGLRNFGPTQTLYIDAGVTTPSPYLHIVSESPDGMGIDGTDLETDAVIICRFFRAGGDVADTFDDFAYLLTVDIHYQCDHLDTPFRFPPFY
jgi:hypothetical protein